MTGCNCGFPAAELLRMRRQLAAAADASHDDEFIRVAAQFVLATDIDRLEHEEATGCDCWSVALLAMDAKRMAA